MVSNNDAVNESLSALLDDEHSELDLRRVLKAAEQDETVMSKWASYQLTRQVMKKDIDRICDDGFLSGIKEAIRDEQPEIMEASPISGRRSFSWHTFAGKAAVAACFTFVFLVGANQWSANHDDTQVSAELAGADASSEPMAVVPSGFELPPLTARTVSTTPNADKVARRSLPTRNQVVSQPRVQGAVMSPELEAQIHHLMLMHAESSAANGGMGVMPFTRVDVVESEAAER